MWKCFFLFFRELFTVVPLVSIVIIEIESLLGLADSPLEMRLCASNHGDQMNLTVITKHKQHDTTVLNTKNTL